MNKSDSSYRQLQIRAETLLEQSADIKEALSHKDVSELIHDLSVHQIELEMQNEDLQWAQREMQQARDEYANLYHHAPVGYLTIDRQGMILKHNQTLGAMLGDAQATHIGVPLASFVYPHDRDVYLGRYKAFFKTPERKNIDVRLHQPGGKLLWVRLSGRNDNSHAPGKENEERLLLTVADISMEKQAEEERSTLEKQMLHAQKMESLVVLAGGISHEFNNILMAIIGNADLAMMRLNPESPVVDNLKRIVTSAARATDLAKQMLAYSGKGKFKVERIDLNRLLDEMTNMLEVSISKKALLRFNLHKHLPPVDADASQMRQIVMNLAINASEAIGDASGVIAITTGCMNCDHTYLKDVLLEENLTDGLYVYLEISDTGCGIDRETLPKVFDPFFSTKFVGRGLGLAAVMGIVRAYKGAIKVYSEPGKGCTFKILLPASGRH
ncbi:MAG TPA: PAS domain S-box protein [Desulfuromonadales bacterium]|nr:PAS domain S-box protein [Desulfuromonadales bacterium]